MIIRGIGNLTVEIVGNHKDKFYSFVDGHLINPEARMSMSEILYVTQGHVRCLPKQFKKDTKFLMHLLKDENTQLIELEFEEGYEKTPIDWRLSGRFRVFINGDLIKSGHHPISKWFIVILKDIIGLKYKRNQNQIIKFGKQNEDRK